MFFTTGFISAALIYAVAATISGPVLDQDFPDPSVITVNGVVYAFSTNSGGKNIQVAQSTNNGVTWTYTSIDALPNVGAWATTGQTWAPDVVNRGDGTFVLYYSAKNPSLNTQCIGAATSTSVTGPYHPQATPIDCNQSGGGAIDPAGFQDSDGTRYVVYKVDGNNLGGGGSCGNGDGSHSTPIMLQKLDSTGLVANGAAVQILDRSVFDGPLIEAPSLIKHSGTYALFFSSNCYNTDLYDISYATAPSVSGPYTKAAAPFKVTGNNGLTAPGGLDPSVDGTFGVFHATTSSNPLVRKMYTAQISWSGNIASA